MIGQRLGVLGGTFDPIHLGHVHIAETVRDLLGLERVLLIPSRVPPHRTARPRASAFHRFAMTALAAAGRPQLVACEVELEREREGPSYTAETLRHLHAVGHAPEEIFFITGADAFAEIATWFDYPQLLDACHFVAVERPGFGLDQLLTRLPDLAPRFVRMARGERDRPAFDRRASQTPLSIVLADASMPDISSTGIRQRLARGGSIDHLVTPLVAEYIASHQLYEAVHLDTPVSQASHLHE